MSEKADDLPVAIWSGSFRVLGVELRVHNLSDGQRIIEAECVEQLLEAMESGATIDHDEMQEFAKWQKGL